MDAVDALTFADAWVRDWNAHNVEAVLEHFANDVVFTSPVAATLMEGSGGVIRGSDALRDYWREGIRRQPDLHFHVVAVYVGINTLVINYRNQAGRLVNEVLIFDGPLVIEGHGTYLESASFAG